MGVGLGVLVIEGRTPGDPCPLPACQLKRRGMSLMELLLVLALLSTVVAISWPALRRPLNRSQAQAAAQQVQRDLMKARRAAMESGQVYLFQYYLNRRVTTVVRCDNATVATLTSHDRYRRMTADGESADADGRFMVNCQWARRLGSQVIRSLTLDS